MHISNIYADGELDKEGTYKKFLLVRQENNRHLCQNLWCLLHSYFSLITSFQRVV